MSRFKVYSPDQAYLLPPSVRDELGEKHLCFFVRGVMERLDMRVFEHSYSSEGGELYAPQLMLGVWLYAYALGITSARQVERRLVEDLAFRYLAAGERIDNWALSAFRRRHGRALNDAFTQVLEWAQQQGMVKLGRVAIDSTRIAANASKDGVDSEQALRDTRAQLRRQVRAWQKAADGDDREPGGLEVAMGELHRALDQLPRRLERLKKSGFSNLARALNLGVSCRGNVCAAAHRRMRAKLRSPAGQAVYARRKAVVEPVFGVFETTARNAPVSHPRAGPSEQRVHPGHDGLQPNPAAHHASRLRRSRKPKPAPGAPAETAASGKT